MDSGAAPDPGRAGPVLRYFDCRSRGQALRFALADSGLDFRDERVPVEALAAFRRDARRPEVGGPFASLPILTWRGCVVAQTLAIAAYLADALGQGEPAATSEERGFRSMIASAAHLDMQVPFSGLLWLPGDVPAERLRAEAGGLLRHLARRTSQLEALLAGRAGPFFGGGEPALADYFAYESLSRAGDVFGAAYAGCLEAAPALARLAQAMEARPRIRALRDAGRVPLRVTASPSELALRERLADEALADSPA